MKYLRQVVSWVADLTWVANAFLRGKVLKQKAYCPKQQGKLSFFQGIPGATLSRLLRLMELWGLRPLKTDELLAATLENSQSRIPYLTWENNQWALNYEWLTSGWQDNHHFIFRK